MFRVYLFIGTAKAAGTAPSAHPAGEQHTVRVFVRQPVKSEPDWDLAVSLLERAGWNAVQLLIAAKFDQDELDKDPAMRLAYEQTLSEGSAIML